LPRYAAGMLRSVEGKGGTMNYKNIRNSDLKISTFNLGTMMFGGQTNETDSLAIMNYAFDQGINLFDTANVYNAGKTERVVAKGLKGRRDKIILATKVGYPMSGDLHQAGLAKDYIISAANDSLQRLETDYIDIYYMHAPDTKTPIEQSLEAMSTLINSGKIRYYAVSNFAAWQIADLLAACDKYNFVKPILTQNVYNPITRGIEDELIPFLNAHELDMTIYNPIAAGLLAGKHKKGKPTDNTRFSNSSVYYDRYWSDANFAAIESIEDIAGELNMTILELTMKWCLSRPNVTSIITGVSRLSQLEQNISTLDGDTLSDDTLEKFDLIWGNLTGNRFKYNR
jgi:aryl-alcohol dehydrogenase-like predicted oxidoreductase